MNDALLRDLRAIKLMVNAIDLDRATQSDLEATATAILNRLDWQQQ
jgi:hypothetical protein